MNPQVLFEENTVLKEQVLSLSQQNTSLNQKNKQLQEQIEWFKRQIFGARSEKIIENSDQLELDLECEKLEKEAKKLAVAAHTRKVSSRKGKDKITLPDDLPVETQVLDIPEEEKIQDGKPLQKIGEEVSQKLAHKPGSYYIKQIIRPKYALPEGGGIRTQRRGNTNPRAS